MRLTITLNFPPAIEEQVLRQSIDLEAEVAEALIISLFRRGRITHHQLSQVLQLDRFETDIWLRSRGVLEGSPTMEDLEADRATLNRIMGRRA
jgi:predicted HTH domain antitoxin